MELTFNEAYKNYIAYVELRQKPQSISTLKRRFKNHILPFFNNIPISEIDEIKFAEWQKYLKEKGFSTDYNKKIHSNIKNLYDYLNIFYNIKNIPNRVGTFENNFEVLSNKSLNVWTIKEFKKFISCVDNKIYHALFNCLYFTGLREGEALSLTFNDLIDNSLKVNKTITKEYFNGKRIITTPKTKKSIRIVRIDRLLRSEIKKLQEYYNTQYGEFNNNFYIFGGKKPLSTSTIDRRKNKYCKLARVKQIRIHDFRHSHATMLYSKHVDLKYIQERLGHDSYNTTANTYIHIFDSYEKRVIKTLNLIRLKIF